MPRDDVNQQGPTHLILDFQLVRDFGHANPTICLFVVVPESGLETYPKVRMKALESELEACICAGQVLPGEGSQVHGQRSYANKQTNAGR